MATRWRWAVEGVDEALLMTRPAPAVWSASEYAHHTADVLMSLHELVPLIVAQSISSMDVPRPVDASADDARPRSTCAKGIARIEKHASRLDQRVHALSRDQRRRSIELDGLEVDAEWVLRHAVHDSSHHVMDVGRGLHTLGAGAPRQEGEVRGVFASAGGVPKRPLDAAVVGYRGVEGDTQHSREHHGRVWQALCVWSTDVVDRLHAEGHPIAPGNAGENVAIAGVDWATLRPGTRIAIGDVLAEISAYSTPCKKNAAWFLDGDFNRMSQDREPGVSRLYASVLRDGTIRPGDRVVVEP